MWPKAVERPGHDQLFQNAAVNFFDVRARAQIEQVFKVALFTAVTRLQNGFNRPFPDAFDGADTVNDLAFIVNVEMVLAAVDVRRQDFQPHTPALIHQPHHLIGVVHIGGHYRRHKLGRVVCLQPQRLVGHQSIGGGVRLVEAITGEFLHQIEDFYRQFAVDAACFCPILETATLLGHFNRVLLPIARRSMSAPPSEYPASTWAICITCS